ncbi:MAG: hypothetical protein IIB31_02950 [Chloroflexi bacterium]|nr:hypothetical protein [Chloroflexota bacterium]
MPLSDNHGGQTGGQIVRRSGTSIVGALALLFLAILFVACGPAALATVEPTIENPAASAVPNPTLTATPADFPTEPPTTEPPTEPPEEAPTAIPQPAEPPELVEELAPIQSVTLELDQNTSQQAELVVISGLPNSCYSPSSESFSRRGTSITVEIFNSRPADPNQLCAQVFRSVTSRFPLDDTVKRCVFYQATVNGTRFDLQISSTNLQCLDTTLAEKAILKLRGGETVLLSPSGLALTFYKLDDSRCAKGAFCLRGGSAEIVLGANLGGKELDIFSFEVGDTKLAGKAIDVHGFTVVLEQLEPYPILDQKIKLEEYVATLVIAENSSAPTK